MRCAEALGLVLAALLLGPVAPQRAAAQTDCGTSTEDELVVTPRDRAEGVARNAIVTVRYERDAELAPLHELSGDAGAGECDGQSLCLFEDARARGGSRREPVAGRAQWLDERNLVFVPDDLLRAETDYFPLVTRAEFDSAARLELEFRTGDARDSDPPELDAPAGEIQVAVEAPPAECDLPEGTLRVSMLVPRARDDGDEESVEVLLFLTRAVGLAGPELRARVRNASRDEGSVELRFLLSAEEASDAICVALRAVDGLGRVSEGEPRLCIEPDRRASFEPLCHARASAIGSTRPPIALASLIALGAVAFVRTTSRRRADGKVA